MLRTTSKKNICQPKPKASRTNLNRKTTFPLRTPRADNPGELVVKVIGIGTWSE